MELKNCIRCGRLFSKDAEANDSPICPECEPEKSPETAAEFLLGLIAPKYKHHKLGVGTVLAIGVITTVFGIGFVVLAWYALSVPNAGFAPQFPYGMLFLSVLCALAAVASFIPKTRVRLLPLIALLISTAIALYLALK